MYRMAALKKPKLSKTPQQGPQSGPHLGVLLSSASLKLPICIFLDILQQMPMPFWLRYLGRNSKTRSSKTLMDSREGVGILVGCLAGYAIKQESRPNCKAAWANRRPRSWSHAMQSNLQQCSVFHDRVPPLPPSSNRKKTTLEASKTQRSVRKLCMRFRSL